MLPSRVHTVFRGYAANQATDRRSGLASEVDAIAAVTDFAAPTEKWFPWARRYERDECLEQMLSRSDRTALDPAVRARLFDASQPAIDDFAGSFVMNFETVLITAARLAQSQTLWAARFSDRSCSRRAPAIGISGTAKVHWATRQFDPRKK